MVGVINQSVSDGFLQNSGAKKLAGKKGRLLGAKAIVQRLTLALSPKALTVPKRFGFGRGTYGLLIKSQVIATLRAYPVGGKGDNEDELRFKDYGTIF